MIKTTERWGGSNPGEGSSTSVVKFDEQGRIKEENGNNRISSYEYHSDKIVFSENYSGSQNAIRTYILDGQGRVVKSITKYATYEYEYNNDGYLIEAHHKGFGTQTYTWESGNLVKIVRTYGSTSYTTNITYGNDVITDKLVVGDVCYHLYDNDNDTQIYINTLVNNLRMHLL